MKPITRRDFLKVSSIAAAMAALPGKLFLGQRPESEEMTACNESPRRLGNFSVRWAELEPNYCFGQSGKIALKIDDKLVWVSDDTGYSFVLGTQQDFDDIARRGKEIDTTSILISDGWAAVLPIEEPQCVS